MSKAMLGVMACSLRSILATVLRATLSLSANAACVSPIASRIAFNSFGVTIHKVAKSNYTVKRYKSPALVPFEVFLGLLLRRSDAR